MTAGDVWAGVFQAACVLLVLALLYVPLGDWMARTFTAVKDWRVERAVYRVIGVDSESAQTWQAYARSVIAFSVMGVLFVYVLQRVQAWLPYSLGLPNVPSGLAFNTAVSFVTNTNWQSYTPETTLGYTVQFAGLAVQNFVSAAVGIAVAVALVRGFASRRSGTIGNFWVDLTRSISRILLPLAVVAALALISAGVVQNFNGFIDVHTVGGAVQQLPGGPVASQEAIKELGTNGGGFFNANSAHPFENPNPFTNLIEVFLLLLIPFALTRTYGILVGDRRQGWAVLGFAGGLWAAGVAAATAAEVAAAGTLTGAMEGKEQRFGVWASALFAGSTTGTSTGAVNSMHESFSPLGGGTVLTNMLLGEVSPGGMGSGLYGILVLAIIAVFIAGLMVGRTPEFLGKTIGRHEVTSAALYILVMPLLVLAFTGLSLVLDGPRSSMLASGPHGLSEVMYAFASGSNNNGSAFAGLTADTPWYNLTLATCMFLGRFVPMVLVLRLAGSLVGQARRPTTVGTMPTHTPLFVGLLAGVTLIVAGLTFFPALALGPIAEALS